MERAQRFSYFRGSHPLAFGHRGGAALWPENTLLGFRGAVALGVTHIETDLHLTRDGVLVCFHDDILDRTTDGRGPLVARSWPELAELDAGHNFTTDGQSFPFRGRGVRIPRLDEVLQALPETRFNLEIKPRDGSVAEPLWHLIEEIGAHDRVLVASAHEPSVRGFRTLCGGRVCTSAGSSAILRFWLASRLGMGRLLRPGFEALQVPLRHGALTVVDKRFVACARHHGIEVHVWTVNDEATMDHLLGLQVDAIMSDHPDRLVAKLRSAR